MLLWKLGFFPYFMRWIRISIKEQPKQSEIWTGFLNWYKYLEFSKPLLKIPAELCTLLRGSHIMLKGLWFEIVSSLLVNGCSTILQKGQLWKAYEQPNSHDNVNKFFFFLHWVFWYYWCASWKYLQFLLF